jgi:hypothetical protein
MVVIFGWGAGEAQDLGEVAPVTCPNCHNHVFLHHIRSQKRVSLYFVPLVPYGTDEYLSCPICRHGLQLKPGQQPAVNEMRASTSLFRRRALNQAFYQSRVEQFWAAFGVAPSGQQVLRPAPTIPPPASVAAEAAPGRPPLAEQLRGLGELHADGVLADEEFAAAKRRLLDG